MEALRVLHVTAEYSPLAKTGGLADAVAGLTAALAARGHDVRVLLPAYAAQGAGGPASAAIADGRQHEIDGPAGAIRFSFREVEQQKAGPRIYLLDSPSINASSIIYTNDAAADGRRFMTLCNAAVALITDLDWRPDIIHCHDWHTGAVPALLRAAAEDQTRLAGIRTVLTIHNIGYQGAFPARECSAAELAALGTGGAGLVNMLEAGIRSADWITTVSPTHAAEVLTSEYGMGLETLLADRRDRFSGILNGADYALWDPAHDDEIAQRYDRRDRHGKQACVQALAAEFGLGPGPEPIAGVISRLAAQKGIDFVIDALPAFLEKGSLRAVVLGDGEPELAEGLRALAGRFPRRFAFVAGHDNPLAHRILAGSELVLVPSRYEPCGLTQMYAMHYGAIPVVRRTGGLADTVTHFDPARGAGTGSVFEHADAPGLAWAIAQALQWHADHDAWQAVVDNAMAADFSWSRQVSEFVELYRQVAALDSGLTRRRREPT